MPSIWGCMSCRLWPGGRLLRHSSGAHAVFKHGFVRLRYGMRRQRGNVLVQRFNDCGPSLHKSFACASVYSTAAEKKCTAGRVMRA